MLRPGAVLFAGSTFAGEQGQGEVFGGGGAAARGLLEGGVAAVRGILGLLAVKDLLDGEDLKPGPRAIVAGAVEAGFGGFFEHGFGGLVKRNKDADLGLFAFENAAQVADLRDSDMACFDGENDLLRFT